ncbi:MAG TPA: hypothetical protein VIK93_01660 [Limnochordales bacterium]
MRLFLALLILGGYALLQAPSLNRRGQRGELWAMLALTVLAIALFALHEARPNALQYPMVWMRSVFAPIGYWIVGY